MTYLINFLTWFRLISGPIIFFLILIFDLYGFALILFMLASISDYLDGYLARKYDCESVFGEILDPIADKILTLFLISTLSLYFQSFFIGFIGSIILSRELWVGALRDMNARGGNKQATSVSYVGKLKTTFQFMAFFSYLVGVFLNNAFIIFISGFILFAALIFTIYSGFLYTINSFSIKSSQQEI